jgi:cytochrome d ubiquinol oxidase subunit I
MRTADATSGPGATIAGMLALFVLAYGVVFWFGIYYINRLIAQGPRQVAAGRAFLTELRAGSRAGRRPRSNATLMGAKPWNGISRRSGLR